MADYIPKRFRNIPHQSGRKEYDARTRYRVSFSISVEQCTDPHFSFLLTDIKLHLKHAFERCGVKAEPVYHNFEFKATELKGVVLVPTSLDFDTFCFTMDMMDHTIQYENFIWWYGSYGSPPAGKETAHLKVDLQLGPFSPNELKRQAKIANKKYPDIKICLPTPRGYTSCLKTLAHQDQN